VRAESFWRHLLAPVPNAEADRNSGLADLRRAVVVAFSGGLS